MPSAYVIFEGGGARGIAHIGALKAAEALHLQFEGIAGTSAGAIVAAFTAVGFTADELLNTTAQTHALGTYCGVGPVDLFGAAEWRAFCRVQASMARASAIVRPRPIALPPPAGIGSRLLRGGGHVINAAFAAVRFVPKSIVWLWAFGRHPFRLNRAFKARGWFKTDEARTYFNKLLHCKLHNIGPLAPQHCPDVFFRDLPDRPPLRIVATDIDSKSIRVFSKHATVDHPATPDVAVADAVAASISVPLFFSPKVINQRRFLDGGLVSNLPMWLFDEERQERPNLPTIAFTLSAGEEGPIAAQHESTFAFLERVGRSAIFGGQSVGRRAIDNLLVVDVPANLNLLDFDADWDTVTEVYGTARDQTLAQLTGHLIDVPTQMSGLCQMVHAALVGKVAIPPARAAAYRMRVNIVQRTSPNYLRVRYGYNMDDDTDDHALLPIRRSISGEAWRGRQIIGRFGRANMRFTLAPPADDKYRQALLWKDLESIISVPVFDSPGMWKKDDPSGRSEPIAILNIDSNESLEAFMASTPIIDFLKLASDMVGRALVRA